MCCSPFPELIRATVQAVLRLGRVPTPSTARRTETSGRCARELAVKAAQPCFEHAWEGAVRYRPFEKEALCPFAKGHALTLR
jgi:hypothetical protein